MKKAGIITILFLLTACSSEVEFTKTCTIKTKSENITDVETRKIIYNNDDIVKQEILTKTYKAKNDNGVDIITDIKKAIIDYNNKLAKSENIKVAVTIDTDEKYQVTYYIDVQNLTDSQLEQFDLKTNSTKLFNKLEKANIECK